MVFVSTDPSAVKCDEGVNVLRYHHLEDQIGQKFLAPSHGRIVAELGVSEKKKIGTHKRIFFIYLSTSCHFNGFFSFHTWESWCLLLQLRACCRLCTTPPFFSDLGFWKRREKKKKMKCRWEKMCLRSIRLTEYVLMLATRTCDDRKQLNFWSFVQLAKLLKYDISSFLFRENRKRQFRATINTILDIFFSCVPKSYTKE